RAGVKFVIMWYTKPTFTGSCRYHQGRQEANDDNSHPFFDPLRPRGSRVHHTVKGPRPQVVDIGGTGGSTSAHLASVPPAEKRRRRDDQKHLSPRSKRPRLRAPRMVIIRTEYEPRSLVPRGVQAHADDTIDQLWKGDTRLEGGLGEVLVLGENGIRIGFDEIDFVVRREAQIEPRVAVDGEQVVDAFAGPLDWAYEGGSESCG